MPVLCKNATETMSAVISGIFIVLDLEKLSKELNIEFTFNGFDEYKEIKDKIYITAYKEGKIDLFDSLMPQITTLVSDFTAVITAIFDIPSLGWASWGINMVDDFSGRYGKGSGYAAMLDTTASLCIFTVAGACVAAGQPVIGLIAGIAGTLLYNHLFRDIVEEFAYYVGLNWYLEK